MTLVMLENKVAVLPLEDPDRIGHIWIPEQGKQRVDQGIIKYRGSETKELRVGDHVIFSGYTGTKISAQGEGELFVMREEDVVAIFPEESEPLFALSQINQILEDASGELQTRISRGGYVVEDRKSVV